MFNLDDLTYRIRLDDSEVERVAARTAQNMGKLGQAAVPVVQQFGKVSENTRLTRQEMMALNYTLSDVAASLSTGASPFTILLQQGGQLKDSFGGVGPLFAKIGQALTVARVAFGATAVAIGSLAYSFVKGYDESTKFDKALALTNNAAGLTRGKFDELAEGVARSSGGTIGSARAILQMLLETGTVGPQAIGEVGAAAAALAKATGRTEEDVVKDFASMSGGVAKWAMEHNRSMNFITADQYKYIRSLEAAGKTAEAQIFTSRLVEQSAERVTQNLGTLEQAWDGVKNAASRAWNGMLGVGRTESLDDKLAAAQKMLSDYQQRGMQNPIRLRDLKENLKTLQEAVAIERGDAARKGADAEKNRKEIEQQQRSAVEASLSVERSQFARSQAAGELARERERIAVERQYDQLEINYSAYTAARERLDREALAAKEASIAEEIALERRRVVEKPEDQLQQVARLTDLEAKRLGVMRERAQLDERIRRGEAGYQGPKAQPETAAQQFYRFERQQQAELERDEKQRVVGATERASELGAINRELQVSLIKDDRERASKQLDIEEKAMRARLDLSAMSATDRKRVEDDLLRWRQLREEQVTEQLKPEYQRRLELYQDFNRYMRSFTDEFREGFIESGRDAFRTWVETGKVSVDGITSYVRRKFADLVYDQYLAGIFDQLGQSIFSFLTGMGGGGGGVGITSGGVGLVDLGLGGGRASGGSVRRGSFHPVNESGTELLSVKGRDYLMMGSNFGRVTPAGATAARMGGAGGATYIDNSTHIGQMGGGVSRGEVQAMLKQYGAKQELRFRRLSADGRLG